MTGLELARLRQALYRFHGAAYMPPEPERLQLLRASVPVLEELGVDILGFAHEWRKLVDVLEEAAGTPLGSEYVRLFEAGVGGAVSPPFESTYLADARTGGAGYLLAQLRATYQMYGFEPSESTAGAIDHIAVELETMSGLCGREGDAWQAEKPEVARRRLDQQLEFLTQHLVRWVPGFARLVERHAEAELYRALARSTHAMVHHDRDLVAALRQEVTA